MSDYRPSKRRIEVSSGEPVRILRDLQKLSQNELSDLAGIPQSTVSAIENARIRLGVEQAKVLDRALRCHPAVFVFSGREMDVESAAWQLAAAGTLLRHAPCGKKGPHLRWRRR